MLEKYLKAPATMDRFRASPAGPYIDGFAAELHRQGYQRDRGCTYLHDAVHLGRWAVAAGHALGSIDEEVLRAFVDHLGSCHCPHERVPTHERAGVQVCAFMGYLRMIGVAGPPKGVEEATQPRALVEFREWLRRQRGASEWTVKAYCRVIRGLIERLGEDPAQYEPQALRRVARELAADHGSSKAEQVVTATRAFLRHLALIGRCSPYLADAIPSAGAWTQTRLPKHLPAEDIEKLIASCNTAKPSGLRARAILLLLARLGLRSGDVIALRLGDLDWADASFRVCGKGRREARLPLPQEVGEAILAYLERGRPPVRCEQVFLTARAPWGPISNNSTIAQVVEYAIRRAGVDAPTHGAHLLRHSAATAMLRDGASLPSIGAVLRHRSIETTIQYARVDGRLLEQVAQPWPEAAQDAKAIDPPFPKAGIDERLLRELAQPWPGEVSPC